MPKYTNPDYEGKSENVLFQNLDQHSKLFTGCHIKVGKKKLKNKPAGILCSKQNQIKILVCTNNEIMAKFQLGMLDKT